MKIPENDRHRLEQRVERGEASPDDALILLELLRPAEQRIAFLEAPRELVPQW